jgi:hypothetical protein
MGRPGRCVCISADQSAPGRYYLVSSSRPGRIPREPSWACMPLACTDAAGRGGVSALDPHGSRARQSQSHWARPGHDPATSEGRVVASAPSQSGTRQGSPVGLTNEDVTHILEFADELEAGGD